MPKTIRFIWNAVTTVLAILVVAAAVLLVGVRLVGLTPFVVLSGSMEPTYPTGSLIYVKQVDPQDVEVGDPITFVLNEDLTVATHRVVEINEEEGWFRTKGDANDSPDGSPVLFENLIGVPQFCIPKLGYLTDYLTNPPGMYIGWSVVAVLLILLFTPELLKWADKADQKAAAKKAAAQEGGTPKGRK
ncbi:signal peptidase I [Flavonifractor sp. An135]|nr:signal peptidase I [Flavonifractor sp. An135]OUQ23020.1 signal peptidase I [Flavonifractor sp. An135]